MTMDQTSTPALSVDQATLFRLGQHQFHLWGGAFKEGAAELLLTGCHVNIRWVHLGHAWQPGDGSPWHLHAAPSRGPDLSLQGTRGHQRSLPSRVTRDPEGSRQSCGSRSCEVPGHFCSLPPARWVTRASLAQKRGLWNLASGGEEAVTLWGGGGRHILAEYGEICLHVHLSGDFASCLISRLKLVSSKIMPDSPIPLLPCCGFLLDSFLLVM